MLKILTAMDNPELNNRLKNVHNFNVYINDIQYKEGIIDILKKDSNFDILIIFEKLPGEIEIEKLIKKIKEINNKIKIIFILENKNEKLEKILFNENIKNIFYNNKINFNEFINEIKKLEFSEEEILKKEIDKLNEIILNKNNEILKYKNKNNNLLINENKIKKEKIIKNKLINKKKRKNEEKCQIIGFINNLENIYKNNYEELLEKLNLLKDNKRILIINLNKKINYKKINTEKNNNKNIYEMNYEKINKNNYINKNNNYYIKINDKIKLFNFELFLKNKKYYKNNFEKIINNLLNKNKKEYNLILIIFNYKNNYSNFEKYFYEYSQKIIFSTKLNIEEIKKCLILIKIKMQEYLIKKNKIFIIFIKENKYDKNLINKKIAKNIFKDYKIIK